jgi:Xaa-Pro aminopeptidase
MIMAIKDRISQLRSLMKEYRLDAYIITGSDPHLSEYLPDYWKSRQWISGFTGSFGNVVITQEKAGLWTDTRYFIQAENQLKDTGIELYKLRVPNQIDIPTWLATELKEGQKVGVDGFCIGVSEVKSLNSAIISKNIEIISDVDLVSKMWVDRPELPKDFIKEQTIDKCGVSRSDKLAQIREVMLSKHADYHFVASLDDIAWILNIRGCDVSYNPVAISYLLISQNQSILFIDKEKTSEEINASLYESNIITADYKNLIQELSEIQKGATFLIDPNRVNYRIYQLLAESHNIVETENPSVLMKSVKNSVEIEGMRQACIKDGVALTKFWSWLENNVNKNYTEIELADRLSEFRKEQDNFVEESFGSIVAYKENAALPHYSATYENCSTIIPQGLLLIDSGGQYIEGTTDITRTMPVGPLTEEERNDYTLVLKGMINMSMLKFPKGSRGCNIDIIARQALWNEGMDYGHGTGHGVGSFLNVHEGPQSIRQDLKDQAILPGMITSNEPGLYKEGRHGIRHENLILCVNDKTTEFGDFLKFETVTMFYFDTTALNIDLLEPKEIKWLNAYHEDVYNRLSPLLDENHSQWLRNKTKSI